jgi:UDP-N-acetylglucosamine--N-acetylmuramyl-(pentapeptide) pyrophosphoryl-undecaprenol N-acetylglucosamine transferase
MQSAPTIPLVAIACGGTGGHLFPGLAVAESLALHGCDISLLISPKEVDQEAVRSAAGLEVLTLPAVGLVDGQISPFVRGFWQSYRVAKQKFKARPPQAVLAMGGFTSAPPILAGVGVGAATFFHEANSVPGRANRWLAPFVDVAFIGFPSAARRLHCRTVKTTGTPVRRQFHSMDPEACRVNLGLDPGRPVLLVMGGSQGASAVNHLVAQSLALLSAHWPDLQFLHLTGASDFKKVCDAYAAQKLKAVVRPFLTEMELALGAATVAISRAGASSLAELAAMRVPVVLIPYPSAADNHQFYNAWAFVESGAARMLEQEKATPELLAEMVKGLMEKPDLRAGMKEALAQWHHFDAAGQIAAQILEAMARNGVRFPNPPGEGEPSAPDPHQSGRPKMQTANAG